jgi:hypothetical protein
MLLPGGPKKIANCAGYEGMPLILFRRRRTLSTKKAGAASATPAQIDQREERIKT